MKGFRNGLTIIFTALLTVGCGSDDSPAPDVNNPPVAQPQTQTFRPFGFSRRARWCCTASKNLFSAARCDAPADRYCLAALTSPWADHPSRQPPAY